VPIYRYDADRILSACHDIATMRSRTADSVLGAAWTERDGLFRAFATMQVGGGEVEITNRTVFYVPDNYLVANFRRMAAPCSRPAADQLS